jgi:hypothetical protein
MSTNVPVTISKPNVDIVVFENHNGTACVDLSEQNATSSESIDQPEQIIAYITPKQNGCTCFYIRNQTNKLVIGHFRPDESNSQTYESMLNKFSQSDIIDIIVIGNCNKQLFKLISDQFNITIGSYRSLNHHTYYNIESLYICITQCVLSGENTTPISNRRTEPKSIFCTYLPQFDCMVIYGDDYKETNKPAVHIATNVFGKNKHLPLLFQLFDTLWPENPEMKLMINSYQAFVNCIHIIASGISNPSAIQYMYETSPKYSPTNKTAAIIQSLCCGFDFITNHQDHPDTSTTSLIADKILSLVS